MAWERHTPLTPYHSSAHNLPCWPASKAQPRATCSTKCIPHSPRYTGIRFSPSPPSTFSHRTFYTSSTKSAGARPPTTKTILFHPHARVIIKHQLELYSTHVFPSVLEAPCSHPEACMRCTHAGQVCNSAKTPLPWQCLPCESADLCFMAAGS